MGMFDRPDDGKTVTEKTHKMFLVLAATSVADGAAAVRAAEVAVEEAKRELRSLEGSLNSRRDDLGKRQKLLEVMPDAIARKVQVTGPDNGYWSFEWPEDRNLTSPSSARVHVKIPVPEGEKQKRPDKPPANAAHVGSSVQGQASFPDGVK